MSVADPRVEELIELAEASLALGDAAAALHLLDQVQEGHRDNRWAATHVEALRIRGDFDAFYELATASLELMIDEADWGNARRVLLECARMFDAQAKDLECINFLHALACRIRSVLHVDAFFEVQLVAMLASRVASEGDLATATRLLSTVDSKLNEVSDRRARASLHWAQSEIDEYSGNVDRAFDSMYQVLLSYVEEDDPLAIQRIALRLGVLASGYLGVSRQKLLIAKELLAAELVRQLGAHKTQTSMLLSLRFASCDLALGNTSSTLSVLDDLQVDFTQPASTFDRSKMLYGHSEILYALCNLELGNLENVPNHLTAARAIYEPLAGSEWPNSALRKIASAYTRLGDVTTAVELYSQASMPTGDFSWCLASFSV